MQSCGENKIWLENIGNLFCNIDLLPMRDGTLESQLNAITRLVILIFLILLLLFNLSYALVFLLLALIFIIILYYIQRKIMIGKNGQENYQAKPSRKPFTENNLHIDAKDNILCNQKKWVLDTNKNQSSNNAFKIKANPKTKMKPIISPHSHDISQWRENNNVVHSHINAPRVTNTYDSGLIPSVECGGNVECGYNPYRQCGQSQQFRGKSLCDSGGIINSACGCSPNNNGMPVNMQLGTCQKDPSLKLYNENLSTQIIQPGVYVKSEVNHPINANIGISFQQQPSEYITQYNENGDVLYTDSANEIIDIPPEMVSTDVSNIYDPRLTGYADSERSYYDPNSGTTKYYNDDINNMVFPGYLTRSNIDHIPGADTYGPIQEGSQYGNPNTADIKVMAENAFVENQLKMRNEIMLNHNRRMRPILNQRRTHPLGPPQL